MRCFLRFFTPPQSTPMEVDLLHTIREQWHGELERTSQWACYTTKSARPLRSRLPVANDRPPAPEPAANQDAPINKDSKSPNPRSLRQHTPAESIPPCCICFWLSWEIGRFTILICRYLPHQFDKVLNKILILVAAYIYLRPPRTSPASVFTSPRLPHLPWVFQLQ